MDLSQRHILVVGLGATGRSGIAWLRARGARVRAVDSREHPPALDDVRADHPEVDLRVGGLEASALAGIDGLLVSPGVDLREPLLVAARERGLSLDGDIEWFARAVHEAPARPAGSLPQVIAITGSNGKSTVTALVADMACAGGRRVAVGGNFGTPALDLLADGIDCYVLELSSFQLELCRSLRPTAATVLNISADHMDRHGSLEHYAHLKARIFDGAQTAVVNADDPHVADLGGHTPRRLRFGTDAGCEYRLVDQEGVRWLEARGQALLSAEALRLRGDHNLLNALAALALADAVELDRDASLEALKTFSGLPHRCQFVARVADVDWVNDSKGTNVGAMLASLQGLPGPIVLLAGGQAKGGDFTPIGPIMRDKGRAAVLFGEDAGVIRRALDAATPVIEAGDFPQAIDAARSAARPGDTVLLSPGCASFDMFRDYRDRGDQFAAAVMEMAA
ncbi:MAG: UDP-N-acetylmuramoyl-L-alanine--D-glutamate ligase [Salinisphaeraceae bacterium]|jgi:UDP-N-acetylmuramoylalanine--D-glutamate ligase|nr:UDP-N-acetylmuramoyl-L-alanine--D-glutamate ligase [Salinisphaeraceae bacterium]